MSNMSAADGTTRPDAAAGGMPAEPDLPALQGLGDSADDPSDPTAAGSSPTTPQGQADDPGGSGERAGGSDPMPDMSGSSG